MTEHRREPLGKVRTKIVATVGPASRDPATLAQLIEAGVDVFRLNFSHGTHEEHTETLQAIREAARRSAVGSSPSCRTSAAPRSGSGRSRATSSSATSATSSSSSPTAPSDDPHQLTCTYRELPDDLKPGDACSSPTARSRWS